MTSVAQSRTGSARLRFELMGGFAIAFGDGRPCVLPTRKSQALLAYLAVPPGRFHSRDKVTALLWGDAPEAQARQSFRQALARIRRAVGDALPAVVTRGDTIALNADVVTVDVVDLESALADPVEGGMRVAALYKGDFLDGFGVDEAPFEEWRVVERERLRERALEALVRLLRDQSADTPDAAIPTALRILAIDPLQEPVHRALMKLLLRQGRRAAALQQYQACVATLERELATEPEEATRELYRQILRTAGTAAAPAGQPGPAPSVLASAMTGVRAAQGPLIGREAEVERLRAALAAMLDSGGRTLVLSGEAGIGKTRLIREFTADALASGARVLVGRCHETEQALPLNPWIEALRAERLTLDPTLRHRLGAATGAELARVFPELSTPDELPMLAGAQHALLFDALVELIGAEASERPIVLVIEDLHWADAMSARFLAYFGRRLDRLPVLVVGSLRPEELVDVPVLAQALAELRADGRLEELALHALAKDETRLLARSLRSEVRGGRVGERTIDDVWAVSEGNPFIVVESMRAIREGRLEKPPHARLARSVQDFVAARLERLGDSARRLVAVAAVIGRDFSFALLARAARVSDRDAAQTVEELVRRRILDTIGDRLAFSHDWIRHVADDRLLAATRPVLHAAVGDALEALHRGRLDDVADQLGHHYARAGEFAKALPHVVRFAELAAQRYALDEASRAFEQALSTVDELPVPERERNELRAGLHERIGDTHALQWSADAGASHYRRALDYWRQSGQPSRLVGARLYAKLAEAPTRFRGAFRMPPSESEVIGYIDSGLALLKNEPDSIEKARLLMARACLPNLSESRDEAELWTAIESGRQALPIMQALGSARDVSAVLDAIGSGYMYVGEYRAALECHLARQELRDRIEDRAELIDIGCMLARSYVAVGEYDHAVREAQHAVDLGEIGLGGWHIHALLWRTWAYFCWDKWDDASASFQSFRATWEAYGRIYQTFVGELFLLEAVLAARRDDPRTASEYAHVADGYVLRRLLHLPALLDLARDRLDDARSGLEALVADRGRLMPVAQANLLEVLALRGEHAEVEARAGTVLALAERSGATKELAQAHRALGIDFGTLGRFAEAEQHLARALDIYRGLDTRWETARTLHHLGELYRQRNFADDGSSAKAMLEEAHAIFSALGDKRNRARVGESLSRQRGTPTAQTGRR